MLNYHCSWWKCTNTLCSKSDNTNDCILNDHCVLKIFYFTELSKFLRLPPENIRTVTELCYWNCVAWVGFFAKMRLYSCASCLSVPCFHRNIKPFWENERRLFYLAARHLKTYFVFMENVARKKLSTLGYGQKRFPVLQ